jgi:5-hydroxyisourate hydrolase
MISTHVLDTSRGRPAAGVAVLLERHGSDGQWLAVRRAATDADGRVRALIDSRTEAGLYRLTFETAAYFEAHGQESLYPYVPVVFEIRDADANYHVPVLISPYGYSTYRGS